MSTDEVKMVKHGINHKHIRETTWLGEYDFYPNSTSKHERKQNEKETSFSVQRNFKVTDERRSFVNNIKKTNTEKNKRLNNRLNKRLNKLNKFVKIIASLWTASLSSLIIFSIIGYTTPKHITGYHCLTCPTDLYYNTNTGTCQYLINCKLTQFWNGTTCIDKYTYNSETCTNSTQCLSPMTCNLGNPLSTCNCPSGNTLNKCDCPMRVSGSEYFYNGTACTSAISFGNLCNGNYTCQYLTQNTYCHVLHYSISIQINHIALINFQ